MVNADFLSQMKSGAFLINTSRGELIDEPALVSALVDGHLSGAALDAFQHEPPGSDNPLLALPQVIPTPHMGAHSDGAPPQWGMSLAECLAVLSGSEPRYRAVSNQTNRNVSRLITNIVTKAVPTFYFVGVTTANLDQQSLPAVDGRFGSIRGGAERY